jgi:phosphatidylethanolamine/phosphatidyl-N-methylethanolamine N-methyltransferase
MRPDPSRAQYLEFFAASYDEVNYGRSPAGLILGRSHTMLEHGLGPETSFGTVIEVGAGHGNHLPHVRHKFDRYIMTDWQAEEMRSRWPADKLAEYGAEIDVQDASRLTYADDSADRLIASHVLEHIPEPHKVLREWSRVVKDGGTISIALPCDPGLAWRCGRNFGPRRANHAAGNHDYDYWMAREHINSIQNLTVLIEFYFPERRDRWFPLGIKSCDLNLIYVAQLVNRKTRREA